MARAILNGRTHKGTSDRVYLFSCSPTELLFNYLLRCLKKNNEVLVIINSGND